MTVLERRPLGYGWDLMDTAPRDFPILVWAPGRDGLSSMFSVCLWHPDAGFCIDEVREPTHWRLLPAEPEPE